MEITAKPGYSSPVGYVRAAAMAAQIRCVDGEVRAQRSGLMPENPTRARKAVDEDHGRAVTKLVHGEARAVIGKIGAHRGLTHARLRRDAAG